MISALRKKMEVFSIMMKKTPSYVTTVNSSGQMLSLTDNFTKECTIGIPL